MSKSCIILSTVLLFPFLVSTFVTVLLRVLVFSILNCLVFIRSQFRTFPCCAEEVVTVYVRR